MLRRLALFVVFCYGFWACEAYAKPVYQLSTHILDIGTGKPAAEVKVDLFRRNSAGDWNRVASSLTDMNGRIADFLPMPDSYTQRGNNGVYMLRFLTREYFDKSGQNSIYPFVEVVFEIQDTSHYHIPLTLSANGYSTYRGS